MTLPDVRLFGSPLRSGVLILTSLLEETYPSELAQLLNAPKFSVQRIVDALQTEGVLGSRISGVERRVSLDPRYFAYKELRALLQRLGNADRGYLDILSSQRRRPRRARKPLKSSASSKSNVAT